MKSFVFYLVLIALFLTGIKLVNRQQQYLRSMRALAQVSPTALVGLSPVMPKRSLSQRHKFNESYPVSGHYVPATR